MKGKRYFETYQFEKNGNEGVMSGKAGVRSDSREYLDDLINFLNDTNDVEVI